MTDPILRADAHEEQHAREALRAARDAYELQAAWWQSCDHFGGEARERLQDTYSERLAEFVPYVRAG